MTQHNLYGLLKKYMAKVIDCEGISFVESHANSVKLSEYETALLLKIEAEIREETEKRICVALHSSKKGELA